jgi:hypothetical protein
MKIKLIRLGLLMAIASAAFTLGSPVFAQETTDKLGKALDLVQQVEKPAVTLTEAQRIDLLTQAIKMGQEAPNHRLQGHRVLAIQAMKGAIAELRSGDKNNQVAGFLHTADTELGTSVSLARAGQPQGQTPPGSLIPVTPSPPPTIPATPSSAADASSPASSLPVSRAGLSVLAEVVTRLVAQASQKPPGPVEKDVTDENVQVCQGLIKMTSDKRTVREAVAWTYDKFTLEGPLSALYLKGAGALVYGKAKLTAAALEYYKKNPDDSSEETIVNGKVVSKDTGPMVGFGPMGSGFISKVPEDGQIIASFCLVQERGSWKVHCLYLSDEPIQGDNKDFIIRQLSAYAGKISANADSGKTANPP